MGTLRSHSESLRAVDVRRGYGCSTQRISNLVVNRLSSAYIPSLSHSTTVSNRENSAQTKGESAALTLRGFLRVHSGLFDHHRSPSFVNGLNGLGIFILAFRKRTLSLRLLSRGGIDYEVPCSSSQRLVEAQLWVAPAPSSRSFRPSPLLCDLHERTILGTKSPKAPRMD